MQDGHRLSSIFALVVLGPIALGSIVIASLAAGRLLIAGPKTVE